jgi:4-amino-4-deoxy-L-arabinose transferase-like glycosyltransferase
MASALRFFFLLLGLFAAEVLAHITLLHLPYYWDEAGYYVPAAYDFFRTGTLIPFSTLTNAHPPGLSLYLAAAWKLFGFAPVTTRVSMCLAAAFALAAVWRLALDALESRAAAAAVTAMTAVYPVWFAQSTLAQADMLAAPFTLWALCFAWSARGGRRTQWAAFAGFTAAALTKEIAIGTPLALAAWEGWLLLRRRPGRHADWRRLLAFTAPVVPLASWFAYHRWRTGFIFGNPEYLRYNAGATMAPMRVAWALAHRIMHLSLHLNLFVPVAIALGSLLLVPVPGQPRLPAKLRGEVWLVVAANAVLFSVLGGALLTRYLLPMYPLVLLLAVAAVQARFRRWLWFPALAVAAFVAALLLPTPYRVAPEDTLAYRDAVVLEQQAIAVVASNFPQATVLSAWPVTDGLSKPELGYVQRPIAVVPVDNFSLAAVRQLLAEPKSFSTAIVFSTKDDPEGLPFRLGRWNEQAEERYFDFHQDLTPGQVAALLGGVVVWQAHRGAEWAAVLRFAHPQLAMLGLEPAWPACPPIIEGEPEPSARPARN